MRKYLEAVLSLFCLTLLPELAIAADPSSSDTKEGCRHPTFRISGKVLDPAGRPIPGARVSAVVPNCDPICLCGLGPPSPGSPDFSCPDTSTAQGLFALKPEKEGRYWIFAEAEGFLPLRGPDAVLGPQSTEITLVLEPAAKVRGRVLDAEGLPVAGAKVELSERCDRFSLDDPATGEDGLYEISCIKPKRQWAFVTHEAYKGAASRVKVGLGDNWLDVRLGERRLAVRGRVIGPQDEPVEGAQVKSDDDDELLWVETLADGSFSGWVNRSDLPEIRVEKEGYAPTAIAVVPGKDLEIRLARGAVVTGFIQGTSDAQLESTSVSLKGDDPPFWSSAETLRNADGRWIYKVAAVPPGTYSIEARTFNQQEITHGTVTVSPGETEVKVDVVYPPSFEVRGRILDSRPPGTRFNVHFHNGELSLWTEMALDGSFVKSLPEGVWSIDADSIFSPVHFAAAPQTVTVSGGPVKGLELSVAPGTTIRCSTSGSSNGDRFDLTAKSSSLDPRGKRNYESRDCSLSGLAPGSWEATAKMKGGERQVTRRITVEPGVAEMDLDFDLRLGSSTLSGRLEADAPLGAVAVELTSPEAPGFRYRERLTHGTFTFYRLQEGRYHLRVTRGREGEREILYEKDLSLASDLELGTLRLAQEDRSEAKQKGQ